MKDNALTARDVALAVLIDIEKKQAFSGQALQKQTKKHKLSFQDQGLVWQLVYGVTTYRLSLDYVLNSFCRRNISTLSPSLRNLLRLAGYQLIYLDRVPDFAAVNEAVAQAKKIGGGRVGGFINGVLRNILRGKDGLFSDLDSETAEGLSVLYSHPQWLVARWLERWGLSFTRDLCQANNRVPALSVRVNGNKISVAEFVAKAAQQGLHAELSAYSPQTVIFPPGTSFSGLPGYQQGWFIVQGEASALPVQFMDLKPGQDVLDMCSAPGGKTTQIAEIVGTGHVTAWDLYSSRLKLVAANAKRLGLTNISTWEIDATQGDANSSSKYQRVLLDAPCSGFGVLRKKPEIKWTRGPQQIDELSKMQYKLLDTGCSLLTPGGIIIYSTCTLMEEENQQVVEALLGKRRDMRLLPIESELATAAGYVTTYPHLHDMDGFFIAKLIKVV